jgi:AcrR family transcriptional regulator
MAQPDDQLPTVATRPAVAHVTSDQRRATILAVAAEMFAARGFAATTMRSIATQVGVLSGSLYHHFESKEAIADEVVSSYLAELDARYVAVTALDLDPVSTLRALIQTSLEAALTHAHATIMYQNDGNYLSTLERFAYLPERGAAVQRTWLAVLAAGIECGALRDTLDARLAYRLMRDGIWRTVRWYRPSERYPTSRFAAECAEFYLQGLVAPRD